jgi:hypothetical protein
MRNIQKFLILIICVLGCTEEFDLNTHKKQPKLVVEGLITNKQGPYYVRLTKSKTDLVYVDTSDFLSDNAEPVKNAFIVISDNIGNIDTLIPSPVYTDCYHYILNENHEIVDSTLETCETTININKGFYQTTKIQGIAGRTYYLKITTDDNEEYFSEAFMPEVPEIDSLGYEIKISEKDKSEFIVPKIFFIDPPDEENYYLFQLINGNNDYDFKPYLCWDFSIMSDKFLKSGERIWLYVDDGASSSGLDYYIYTMVHPVIKVEFSSLTQDAYNFYKALIEQFNNDGGAYSPSPATPKGNISNEGLGFFRASAVSHKTLIVE